MRVRQQTRHIVLNSAVNGRIFRAVDSSYLQERLLKTFGINNLYKHQGLEKQLLEGLKKYEKQ